MRSSWCKSNPSHTILYGISRGIVSSFQEIDPKNMTMHNLFYESGTFERYCTGELIKSVHPTTSDVFNVEEERVRVEEYYRQKVK